MTEQSNKQDGLPPLPAPTDSACELGDGCPYLAELLNAREALNSLSPVRCSAALWESLDWPNPKARFEIYDDGDPHGQLAIILPGGQLMNCGAHADLATDLRRAKWICDALNAALEREMQPFTASGLLAAFMEYEQYIIAECAALKENPLTYHADDRIGLPYILEAVQKIRQDCERAQATNDKLGGGGEKKGT